MKAIELKKYLEQEVKNAIIEVVGKKRQFGALRHAANQLPSLKEFLSEQLMQQIMYDAPEPKLVHNGAPISIAEIYESPSQFDELYNLVIVQVVDSFFSNPTKKS